MKRGNGDGALRSLFQTDRARDRRAGPDFLRVWQAARSRSRAPRTVPVSSRLAWAAGSLGLLSMVTVLIIHGLPDDPMQADQEIAFASRLFEWEAPTDYLLEVSEAEIISGIPLLETSVLRLPGFPEGAGTAGTDY